MPSRTMLKNSMGNSKRVKATFEVARRQGRMGKNAKPLDPRELKMKRHDYDAMVRVFRELTQNPTPEKLARAKKYYAEYLSSIREKRKLRTLTLEEERRIESGKEWIEKLIKKQYTQPKLPK